MKTNSEKVIEITEDFLGVLFKHEATPEIGFECVAALAMEITLRLCKATHSEEPAHNTAKFLRQLAKDIKEEAKQYANAKMPTEEELVAFEKLREINPFTQTIGEA